MKKAIISLVLVLAISFQGCSLSADGAAQGAVNAIQIAIDTANAELSQVPVAEQPTYKAAVAGLQSLNTQLATCNGAVSKVSLSRSAKFLACFDAFSAGLANPQELAALRLLSPATQAKVQSVVTIVTIALNAVLPSFGGAPVAAPAIISQETTNVVIVGKLKSGQFNADGNGIYMCESPNVGVVACTEQ